MEFHMPSIVDTCSVRGSSLNEAVVTERTVIWYPMQLVSYQATPII